MLTVKMLKDMPPKTMFASGTVEDSPEGVNLTNSGCELKWVAIRGGIWDWTIYIHFDEHTAEWIMRHGDKVYNPHNIRKLVPCDDEAFEMYRF